MAKRKKPKFNKVETVKAMARARIGAPPPARVVPNKKKPTVKKEKHKTTMGEMLTETD